MSLARMLAAHDDAALAALASKGLVRRAGRDAAAGKARVVERDGERAVVDADGQPVEIDARGPSAARCPCPATGICRHVVLAVVALREEPSEARGPAVEGSDDGAAAEGRAGADTTRGGDGATKDGGPVSASVGSDDPDAPASTSATPAPAASDAETRMRGDDGAGPDPAASDPSPSTGPYPSAADELVALEPATLPAFAGADWSAALELARAAAGDADLRSEGINQSVTIPGEDPVTFIAGRGLRDAAFKGPASRRRRVIAAAALLVRSAAGIPLPAATVDGAAHAPDPIADLADAYLAEVVAALERAAAAVLTGSPEVARDRLLDLAVSARVQAAPRLAGALRDLVERARRAAERHVAFQPDRFVLAAARAHALATALRAAPDDPALTGTLQRDYRDADPLELWLLGAAPWRTPGGARGLRVHAWSPARHAWFATGPARGAGMDPAFRPRGAYDGALWGAGAIRDLMGRALALPAPRIADDGTVALTLPRAAEARRKPLEPDELHASGAATNDWTALRDDLRERLGTGLRRRAAPVPALLAPTGFGALAFDDLAQAYLLPALDARGAPLHLDLPGDDPELAHRLAAPARRLEALLVEVAFAAENDGHGLGGDGLRVRPVAALHRHRDELRVWNLHLDRPPQRSDVQRRIASLEQRVKRIAAPATPPPDPIAELADAALDAAADAAGGRAPREAARHAADAEALGLASLADALETAARAPGPRSAFRLAYLAGELRAAAALEP